MAPVSITPTAQQAESSPVISPTGWSSENNLQDMPPHHQHPLNKAVKTGGLTIVLKLGTSSICDPDTHLPQLATLSLMVELVAKLKGLGHRVILVSSGAVGVGLRRLNFAQKPKELAKVQVTSLDYFIIE
ncbi:Glutamate 5-kinase [Dispira simplex]|nr:Glutamate 5-kinase [Dispira simplex]